jgi:hypothetical protein
MFLFKRCSNFSLFGILAVLLLQACANIPVFIQDRDKPLQREASPGDSLVRYRVFLLGDAGEVDTTRVNGTLHLAIHMASDAGKKAVIVMLGDNLYPNGVPDSSHPGFQDALNRLRYQIKLLNKASDARVFYVPGNHDWNNGAKDGLARRLRQEWLIDTLSNKRFTYLPRRGFPGPFDLRIDHQNTFLFLDTQWWLHQHEKAMGFDGENTINEPGQVLVRLQDLILKNNSRNLIVFGHHPLVSNGQHGGYYATKTHLFPLTLLHPALYLPLPLAGSLFPLAVRFVGGRQDLAHPRYKQLRTGLLTELTQHPRLVYAAGHDHSLQYIPYTDPEAPNTIHHITSGATVKSDYVTPGRQAAFTAKTRGFVELRILETNAVWMFAWSADRDGNPALLYKKELLAPTNVKAVSEAIPTKQEPRYPDSIVVRAINPKYKKNGRFGGLSGSGYRQLWATPVPFPVLDIGVEQDGMIPVKRGGGMQTVNIRMLDTRKRQWALRSIDKDASISIPWYLKQTAAVDMLQDQVSSLHPFGSLIIPELSKAAGIRYTRPRLFVVPDDERFGPYRQVTANTVMMLEERPDDAHASSDQFGNADEIVGDEKLYENIAEDNDHQVDQRAFARARFFDLWIGDWDRHKGQWSWAKYKSKKTGTIYKPVPRDRDFAFFRFEGPIPMLVSAVDPKFSNFGYHIGDIEGITKNGFDQDRRLMNSLSRKDWQQIADSLMACFPDTVIDRAMFALPDTIRILSGNEIAAKLKSRRADILKAVDAWYLRNNLVVDIPGSNKHERYDITFFGKDSLTVVMYKTGREGDIRKELYRRTFYPSETKEVRLYGLAGNDRFFISGDPETHIKVRIIGGAGEDHFETLTGTNYRHAVDIFDTRGNSTVAGPGRPNYRFSDDPLINEYRPNGFRHNVRSNLAFFDYNIDDGVFLGGGVKWVRHDFRQFPYASDHRLKANVASRTLGYNVIYEGHYRNALDPFDIFLESYWLSPTNILNFYGFGNNTKRDEDAGFYQIRLQQAKVSPLLYKRDLKGNEFRFGPNFQMYRVKSDVNQFLRPGDEAVSRFDLYNDQTFLGWQFLSTFHNLASTVNPKSGFRWLNGVDFNTSLKNTETRYMRLFTDLSIYSSVSLQPQITFANRFGLYRNIGEFPFYHANTLGGTSNLRGFRSDRFTGRTAAFANTEVRFRMFDIKSYLMVGEMGGLLFVDAGRVWAYGKDTSRYIHRGYGGGIWFNVLDYFLISATAGYSREGIYINSRVGFQF